VTPLGSGLSFCIITNGKRPKRLQEEIDSIVRLGIPSYEILVAGKIPGEIQGVRVFEMHEAAQTGRLGLMRNRLAEQAKFDTIVNVDDDFVFHQDFYTGLTSREAPFDILSTRILNPDGTRFWDWAVFGAPTGHHLISYDDVSPYVYITGGFSVQRREVVLDVRWNEEFGLNQAEDVDYSRRAQAKGYSIEFCREASVTHNDQNYTRIDDLVFRQPLPGMFDEIGLGLLGRGFYPLEGDGTRFIAPHSLIRVPSFTLLAAAELSLVLQPLPSEYYSSDPVVIHIYKSKYLEQTLNVNSATGQFQVNLLLESSRQDIDIDLVVSSSVVPQLLGNHRDKRIISARLIKLHIESKGLINFFFDLNSETLSRPQLNEYQGIKLIGQELDGSIEGFLSRRILRELIELVGYEQCATKLEPICVDPSFTQALLSEYNLFSEYRQLLSTPVESGIIVVHLPLRLLPDPGFLPRVWQLNTPLSERIVITYGRNLLEIQTHIVGLQRAKTIYVWNESQRQLFLLAGIEEEKLRVLRLQRNEERYAGSESSGRSSLSLLYCIQDEQEIEIVCAIISDLLDKHHDLAFVISLCVPPWRRRTLRLEIEALLDEVLDETSRERVSYLEKPFVTGQDLSVTHILAPLENPDDPRYEWLGSVLGLPILRGASTSGIESTAHSPEWLAAHLHEIRLQLSQIEQPNGSPTSEPLPGAVHVHNLEQSLKVAIDCRSLYFPEISERGIGAYTKGFLTYLAHTNPKWQFTLCVERNEEPDLVKDMRNFANIELHYWHELAFDKFDVVHLTDQMSMLLGYDAPLRMVPREVVTTLTFYDLIPLALPHLFYDTWPERMKEVYQKRLDQVRTSSVHIFSISENTKSDLIKYVQVPPERITTIYGAASIASTDISVDSTMVRAKYRIAENFVLVVGGLDKQKNFEVVLAAYVEAQKRASLNLVVVGSFCDPYKELYFKEVQRLGIPGVVFTGYLPDEELNVLYRTATVTCFVSLYEGLGVPVLEAMARGCPVITSTGGSLPEVAGEEGLVYDPSDIQGIADAIVRLAQDPVERQRYGEYGHAQSLKFSWKTTVERVKEAWSSLLHS
jgi:glycosyltransferase involved in cell wall biosynthesis